MDLYDNPDDTMNTETEASTYADAAAYYGYEDRISSEILDSFPEGPGSPLPADRLARKQRLFVRRGGACHSTLLQSAVMACMSSPKDDEGKPGFTSLDSASLLTSSSGEGSTTSPRKRLRRTDKPKAMVDDNVVAGASVLLASLSMSPLDTSMGNHTSHHTGDFKRAPPIRRVSRRKSYTSVASGASDYDDEEFAELLDD